MNILFLGSTGLIGNNILKNIDNINYFKNYNKIFCFTRKKISSSNPNINLINYTFYNLENTLKEIIQQNPNKWVILLFTGETIFDIITSKKWEKIYNSRVLINKKVINILEETKAEVDKIISSSAIGIYYKSSLLQVNENSPIEDHYFTNFIKEWENSTLNSIFKEKTIIMRLGAVISENSKIFKSLKLPSLFSIGINFTPSPPFPWIHNNEIPLIIDFLLEKNQTGIFNIVNPNYLTYQKFLEKFIKANSLLKKSIIINIPKNFLESFLKLIMPKYYEVIYSLFSIPQIIPQRLIDLNYPFKFNDIL